MSPPIILTQRDTPGVYATDAEGCHWTTVTLVGRVVSPPSCAICGAVLPYGGWARHVQGVPREYVCDAHVELRRLV